MNRRLRWTLISAMATAAALFAASCGGSSSSSGSSASSESIRGQTITVLVPYAMPQKLLSQFTAETGVKVNYVVTGWDATHNKLLVANEANTYIADVAEFDWSFTGQFAGAGWVEPLDNLLSAKTWPNSRAPTPRRVRRQDLRGLLFERLPAVHVQQADVRQGGNHRVPGHVRRACG